MRGLAEAAGKRLRRTDHLYRPSRHQFVVLATGCPPERAEQLGRELQNAMARVHLRPSAASDHSAAPEVRAGLALGISSLKPRHDSVETLLQRALQDLDQRLGPAAADPSR